MRPIIGAVAVALVAAGLGSPAAQPSSASSTIGSSPPLALDSTMYRAAEAPLGIPAESRDWPAEATEMRYPAWGPDKRATTATWRVVTGTGNCCENRLAVTSDGRLIDFGAQTPKISDDEGITWTEILPAGASSTRATLGEGDAVAAPNGDIVGVSWYMLGGDSIVSFKYDAALEEWFFSAVPVHQPFFDRPELTVVPGPLDLNGTKVPYAVVLKGGSGLRMIYYVSGDGLNYTEVGARREATFGPDVKSWLKVDPAPVLDWIQAHEWSGLTPIAGGRVVSLPSPLDVIDQSAPPGPAILDLATLTWSRFALPDGQKFPKHGRLLTDSRGWIHHAVWNKDGFTYRISTNEGRTWTERTISIPKPYERAYDDARHNSFKVNGKLGLAVVAIHGRRPSDDTTRDFVFKIDVSRPLAKLLRTFAIGLGDGGFGAGVETADGRYDFANVAILPDGRIATSFADMAAGGSALAIEI